MIDTSARGRGDGKYRGAINSRIHPQRAVGSFSCKSKVVIGQQSIFGDSIVYAVDETIIISRRQEDSRC